MSPGGDTCYAINMIKYVFPVRIMYTFKSFNVFTILNLFSGFGSTPAERTQKLHHMC